MNHNVVQLAQEMVAIRSVSQWSNAEVSDFIEAWLRIAGSFSSGNGSSQRAVSK